MEIAAQLLIYTSILGFILGFVVTKTNFCTMGAVSDWVNIGDLSRFKAWMFAAAIAILGVTVLDFLSLNLGFFHLVKRIKPYLLYHID